jgi:hypothetical protein
MPEWFDARVECVDNVFSVDGIFGGVYGRTDREHDRIRVNEGKEGDSERQLVNKRAEQQVNDAEIKILLQDKEQL